MFDKILHPFCLYCGGECAYNEMICLDCVANLPVHEHFCANCGHPLAVDAVYCRHCDDKERAVDFYYTDYVYQDAIKAILYNIKFNWHWRAVCQLGAICSMNGVDFGRYDRIVSIPYHFLRRFVRYYQPVDLVMRKLATVAPDVAHEKVLYRVKNTEYLARLSRKQRLKNVKNVFELRGDIVDEKILLVDDIITTGATISEAARVLKRAGAARVDVYTFAAGATR